MRVSHAVGALVVLGSVAMGSAGVAEAAPAPNCTHAAARIARLQNQESALSTLISSLEAQTPHGRHHARELRREIALLTRVEASLAARVTRLQAACPTGTTGTGTTGTGTTGTGTTSTGNTGGGGSTFTGSV